MGTLEIVIVDYPIINGQDCVCPCAYAVDGSCNNQSIYICRQLTWWQKKFKTEVSAYDHVFLEALLKEWLQVGTRHLKLHRSEKEYIYIYRKRSGDTWYSCIYVSLLGEDKENYNSKYGTQYFVFKNK